MAVYLNRPPHNVRLVAWGRADDGWWACITWRQRVRAHGEPAELDMAAWVPAGAVTQPQYSTRVAVPRILLAAERHTWPAPPGWPHWYAGVWIEGPVVLPPGTTATTGPAWRQRGARS